MIKMSAAPASHSPRITAITPPRTQTIAARNAAPQAIRIANIAITPQRGGVNPGGAPHDGQTRSGPSYALPQRTQIGISLHHLPRASSDTAGGGELCFHFILSVRRQAAVGSSDWLGA